MSQNSFFSLAGQVAVITGGGQGLGEGIARRLHAAGAKIAVLDINQQNASSVAQSVEGIGIKCDVSSAESVASSISEVRQQLGGISIVVNSAGITGRSVHLWELEAADLDQVYSVNLRGTFLLCRAVIGEMLDRKYGRILNIASIAGKEGNPRLIPYSSTKAAVIALTKALAKEVVGLGDITVNSISPAVVHTKLLDTVSKETIDYMISKIPMGRPGKIEEIAALVHYLVSSEASFTTGQCYDISGGRATY
jgi:NAD(P)-dependent dehydrogenase (short-subunit alcohol dehydrogenase family)